MRATIVDHLADFARELGDTAPLAASVTRAAKLYRRSGLSLEEFVATLYAARAKTKEWTASIKAEPVADGRAIPLKPKMAYFFAVLEDLVGPRGDRRVEQGYGSTSFAASLTASASLMARCVVGGNRVPPILLRAAGTLLL